MNANTCPLANITIDGGTQMRAEINQQTVAEYADDMGNGAEFPPVIVFTDGVHNWLADGFHRYHAARQAGLAELPVDKRAGTLREAILFAARSNINHGMRRTNADKRKAVMALLADDEWSQWPDSEIAANCGVGRQFVHRLRHDLTCTTDTSEPVYRKYIDKHGNESMMDVSRIGKNRATLPPIQGLDVLQSIEPPVVYVIESGSRVKVGWSKTPTTRVTHILRQNPDAVLMGCAPGGRKVERTIHAALECERDVGEWFLGAAADVFSVMDKLQIIYTTKHGTEATMNTSKIGKKRASPKPLDERAAEIRPLIEQGKTPAEIAAELDLNQSYVKDLMNRSGIKAPHARAVQEQRRKDQRVIAQTVYAIRDAASNFRSLEPSFRAIDSGEAQQLLELLLPAMTTFTQIKNQLRAIQ